MLWLADLLESQPPTGEPSARNWPARFGGRGDLIRRPYPYQAHGGFIQLARARAPAEAPVRCRLPEIEEVVDMSAVRECDSPVKTRSLRPDKKLIDCNQAEWVRRPVCIPAQHQQPARLEYASKSLDCYVLFVLSIQSIAKDAIDKSHIELMFRIERCNCS